MDDQKRIVNVFLDHRTVVRRYPEIDHDRAVAIFDLLDENFFDLVDGPNGPYNLHLSVEENRLLFAFAMKPIIWLGILVFRFQISGLSLKTILWSGQLLRCD